MGLECLLFYKIPGAAGVPGPLTTLRAARFWNTVVLEMHIFCLNGQSGVDVTPHLDSEPSRKEMIFLSKPDDIVSS